jgi:hypothetical protein
MKTVAAPLICVLLTGLAAAQRAEPPWTDRFDVDRRDLRSTGRHPYFILEPGYVLALDHGRERLVITVLSDTRVIDGVETRVVEERETNGAAVVEVSKNYFVINSRTSDVFYFGEDVDIYRNGKVAGHQGAWRAGTGGARFGLMMPGALATGARYYQELAPGIAMDRARIVTLGDTLVTPAGTFAGVLKIEETTPLEPGAREYKYFAKGAGLLQDGDLKLSSYGFATSR